MIRSRDQFLPLPTRIRPEGEGGGAGQQTARMRLVERRLLALADRFRAPLGMSRRRFLQSGCGLAASFLAMSSVFGPLFAVDPAEAADPEAAAERRREMAGQLIFDVQTHFVSSEYPADTGLLGLRRLAGQWNPDLREKQTIEELQFENFFQEVFLESETALAVLSSAPNDDPRQWFLDNEALARARKQVNGRSGSKRLFSHAIFTPGRPGWLEDLEQAIALRPDAWKGYTVGQPIGESQWPWRLDDEKLVYPAYEKMMAAGITTVCIHKGLLPGNYQERMPSTWKHGKVDDVGQAARDWPRLRFLIYHAGIRTGGIPTAKALAQFEESGEIPWVSDLARIPEQFGVENVYADLGSVFAVSAVSAPRFCAGVLGILIKGLGEDRVLWGTDSVWYGSPQWQIEALRRLEMPEELQRKFGFRPLGPARGPLKNRIFAENAEQVYPFAREHLQTDRLAEMKRAAAGHERQPPK